MPSGPKNTKYYNRHADEARQRDEEREAVSRESKQRAKEDAEWAETDKKALKKLDKQREEAQKAEDRATRQAEKKDQEAQEEAETKKAAPAHVQKRMRQKELAKMLANYDKEQQAIRQGGDDSSEPQAPAELPTTNPNKAKGIQPFAATDGSTISASGDIDHVVASLEQQTSSGAGAVPDNRHIGKRAKVLYRAFCDEHLEEVKEEHPNLRRTQYSDVLWEMWQKSPQNPFVLRAEARDRANLEAQRRWLEGDDEDDAEDGEDDSTKE